MFLSGATQNSTSQYTILGVVGQNNKVDSGGYGAHYYIYWDGTIYKAADHDAVLWQVGTAGYYTQKHPYARNSNTIGIEMCPKCDGNAGNAEDLYWYFTEETQKACVELVKYLMQQLGVGADHVLRHYDIVNKWCPAPYCNNNRYRGTWTWDEFKAKLTGGSVAPSTPSGGGSGTYGTGLYKVNVGRSGDPDRPQHKIRPVRQHHGQRILHNHRGIKYLLGQAALRCGMDLH